MEREEGREAERRRGITELKEWREELRRVEERRAVEREEWREAERRRRGIEELKEWREALRRDEERRVVEREEREAEESCGGSREYCCTGGRYGEGEEESVVEEANVCVLQQRLDYVYRKLNISL